MGKEIGDFAGGLAQGATGGFQQMFQQQMRQRQFEEQREFARTQQASQNTFTANQSQLTRDAADARHKADQQFQLEKASMEAGNLADHRADLLGLRKHEVGLKEKEIDANKEIRLADIERKDTEAGLVAAYRETMVELKKGEVDDAKIAAAHERRDRIDREYRAYLAKSGITLERQNELARAHNAATRARISAAILKGRGPETLAKLTALGFNSKQIDAALEGYERAGNLALVAGYMPEAKQDEMLSLSQNYMRGGQQIYENAKAQGMSELEATNAVIRWSSDHLNDLPRVIGQEKKMRGLEADAKAAKEKLIGELQGDVAASKARQAEEDAAAGDVRSTEERQGSLSGAHKRALLSKKERKELDKLQAEEAARFLRDRSVRGVPSPILGRKF